MPRPLAYTRGRAVHRHAAEQAGRRPSHHLCTPPNDPPVSRAMLLHLPRCIHCQSAPRPPLCRRLAAACRREPLSTGSPSRTCRARAQGRKIGGLGGAGRRAAQGGGAGTGLRTSATHVCTHKAGIPGARPASGAGGLRSGRPRRRGRRGAQIPPLPRGVVRARSLGHPERVHLLRRKRRAVMVARASAQG